MQKCLYVHYELRSTIMGFKDSVAKSLAAFTITGMVISLYPTYDDEGHIHEHPVHSEHPVPLPGPPLQFTNVMSTSSNIDASTVIPL